MIETLARHTHRWTETYYGWECMLCPAFFPSVDLYFQDDRIFDDKEYYHEPEEEPNAEQAEK